MPDLRTGVDRPMVTSALLTDAELAEIIAVPRFSGRGGT
jgi:hypothetical protein